MLWTERGIGMFIYVNVNAGREGNGSKEAPFRHINDAAKIAQPGDEVIVAPGIYRESVVPVNGGTEDQRIVYRSEEPLGALITGAEKADHWEKVEGRNNVWVTRIPNGVFGSFNPYTTIIGGDWYFGPLTKHAGAVYLNDLQFYEADTLDDCEKGEVYPMSWEPEKSVYKWYTEQDGNETVIYANFQGADPNQEDVEINVRRNCFMPDKNEVNYITFSGFKVRRAATTWAPPAAYQDGMIGPHWAKGWIIEDCEISDSRCCGISLGKYYDEENDHYFTTKQVKSATQMERDAVCRGQYHGWLKERIGSHIVRRCHIYNCGQAGIVGRMGCVFSLIEDNHIHHCNVTQELVGAEVAGIKFHAAIDVVFRRNHIHHNSMGIWCDWQAQGTRITQNLMHDNYRPENLPDMPGMMQQDIFIEVGHGPTLIDNNILLSKASVRAATQGVAIVHNFIMGSFTSIGGGTAFTVKGNNEERYTPYHIRHRTEVAGFATILHGDDRVYNNIFIQNWPVKEVEVKHEMGFSAADNQVVGTAVFDDYPTYEEWFSNFDLSVPGNMFKIMDIHFSHLPVWVNGNAYFNGAAAWKNEQSKLIDTEHKVTAELVCEDGKYVLKTNVYELLGNFSDEIINSDTLGKAFEPEQRFENPDGTDIIFNEDYFGGHRGLTAIPGPFASAEDAGKALL